MLRTFSASLICTLILLVTPTLAANQSCQDWPKVLKNMPIGQAKITLSTGESVPIQYRLANTREQLSHGFQFTCMATIQETKILFQFPGLVRPSFHMNNVVAPLDIAFIDETGKITDIFLMETYQAFDHVKKLYSPSKPVLYALEARAGYFADLDIHVGDMILINSIVQ